ncbi:MAG: glycosyl hydrolase [Candidatus Marinimicrobia bacterium]|nr:glycosyl hydrolase [Candidatus Neomarinimicrobiota bacterium]
MRRFTHLLILFSSFVALQAEKYDETFFNNFEWRNIGPNRGGRSLSSMGSPGRPNEYYFGATGGGLWKTTDGGNTWFPVTDGKITSSSIGAVAVAETNPDIVYIGGGETQLRGSITQGDGVYRSTDGGETWRHVGLRETQAIARIRIHPTDPDIVYVAALGHPYGDNEQRGIFRSKDGGNSWEKILYKSPKAGGVDISIDRTNPKVIYASLWQVYRRAWKMWGGGPFSGIYKSTDGGDTWTELTKNPGMPEGPIGKIGMTVSPADANRVWAIVEAPEGGVFRSDDGGKSWERTNDDRKIRQRHFYYSRIVADPWDRETVYALNTRLYKSMDGGVTFDTQISTPHGDQHDLWIDPNDPKRMTNSNDGGGNVSINGGETWTEQDYITTQLYHVNVTNDFPYHVCGAQQDNSTVCVPSDGWNNMQARGPNHGWYYSAGGGESGYITQHPSKLDIFYAGSQGALLTRYDRSTGQIRDIQVYPRFFSGEPASALPERWQWTFPIVFSPLDDNKLYTCSQHVWLSEDDGQSWKKISPDLTYADPSTLGPTGGLITMDMNGPEIYATVFALTPSQHDINTIWAGSDDGLMHITRDGGNTWTKITPPDMPKFSRISIIEESSHTPGTAYVAANRYQVDDRAPYVWRTRDYGKTWTKIVNGVANGHFARAVREDSVKEGLLFLGTEHAVYVSFDAGDSWQSIQLNLPDTPIRDLQLKNSDVVLGTHGRGFWILDDYDPLREYSDRTAVESLTLFNPHDAVRSAQTAALQYYLGEEVDSVKTEIYDSEGNLVISVIGDSTAKKETEVNPWYRTRTTGPPTTAKGLNRWEWNLRYKGATMFEGIIIWSGRPQNGPKAPPGTYEARVTVNGITKSAKFNVKMDPRLEGVTEQDLREQFQLASQIRDRTSAANEAVIQIRHIRDQIDDRLEKTNDRRIRKMSSDLMGNLTKIEEALYQTKNESGQDPLNFPIRLNNRLASLRRSVENGDAKPTDGAYKVFGELSAELDGHLEALDGELTQRLNPLNSRLTSKQLEPVSATVE